MLCLVALSPAAAGDAEDLGSEADSAAHSAPAPACQAPAAPCMHVLFSLPKVGLNVLVQKANKFTPATRLLVQRFVPFPAVGKTCSVPRDTRAWTGMCVSHLGVRGCRALGEPDCLSRLLLTSGSPGVGD